MSVKSLFRYWSNSYFTNQICVLTAIIGIVIFLLRKNKNQPTYIFLYYFIGYTILCFIFSTSATVVNKPMRLQLINLSRFADYLFTLLEFIIFFFFFKKSLNVSLHRRILNIICLVFLSTGIAIFVYDVYTNGKLRPWSIHLLFNVQVVSLLIPCVFFFVEIFRIKPNLDLFREPSFWVTTGLSFFMVSTFPLSLSIDYLQKTDQILYGKLFSLFYIFYILLFLMIIRGHLCKPNKK